MDILQYWAGFYNDLWFWTFPMATLAISMTAFLTLAIPWTIVAWKDPVSLRKYKIQQNRLRSKNSYGPRLAEL